MRCCCCDRRKTPALIAYAISFVLVALAGPLVSAAEADAPASGPAGRNGHAVTVLDLTGRMTTGRLERLDLPGTIRLDVDGKALEIPGQQVIWLGFELAPQAEPPLVQWFSDPPVPIGDKPAPAVQVRLDLLDGQVLLGVLKDPEEPDSVAIEHRLLGTFDVPFKQVRRIREQTEPSGPPTHAIRAAPTAFDVLWLANGDRVEGILRSVDSNEIAVELASGQPVRVPTRSVRVIQRATVRAADTAVASQPAGVSARLRLRDGQCISTSKVGWDSARQVAAFTFQGRPTLLPADLLEGIEPVTGKWQWLTELPVAGYEHQPVLAPFMKWQVDATAAGSRIYCRGSPVPHGLGMPAGSTIRFDLAGAYSRLLVWPMLDDSTRTAGSCKARVLVDGKPQWEAVVKPRVQPHAVLVDLAGKRGLVLHVETADDSDVLTRFVWAWPVLVR